MAQKATMSLILMSGTPLEAFTRARRLSNPPAFAELLSVYCAVLAKDSRMRRAIFSRRLEILAEGSVRSAERIIPPGPVPSAGAASPVARCFFAAEESRGEEGYAAFASDSK